MSFSYNMKPHQLSSKQTQKSLTWVVRDGIAAQIIESLTTGPIIIAIALLMNASNILIGYLVALPYLCNIAQFPGAYFVEKFHKRKWQCLTISSFGRMIFLPIGFLVLNPDIPYASYYLALLYTLRCFCSGFSTSSWNSWMKDLIPGQILGRFFASRLSKMIIAATTVNLLAAIILSFWSFQVKYFYAALMFLAFFTCLIGIYMYYRISEPKMETDNIKESFIKKFKKVFEDRNFTKLMSFLAFWNFSINLAVPFFTVYILKKLNLPMSLVLVLTTITQLMNVWVMEMWGKISDKFSNKSVLLTTGPLYILCIFMFLFTANPNPHILTIPLLILIYIFIGIAQAGITLATGNITLKLAPKGRATVYLSVNGIINAFASGIAPLIGGSLADFFADKELFFTLNWQSNISEFDLYVFGMRHWDFFFFFASVLATLSLILLRGVREEGDVEEKVVLSNFLSMFSKTFSASYLLPQKMFLFVSRKRYQNVLKENRTKEIKAEEGQIQQVSQIMDITE